MKKAKINELFYSLQGEGHHAGIPAVFVRFSGCNLRCPFCDTQHERGLYLTQDEIMEQINRYPTRFVVLTGGEPSLFIDAEFIDTLHNHGKFIAIETNGTHPLPNGIDWVTVSPKEDFVLNGEMIPSTRPFDEVKVVFDGKNEVDNYLRVPARYHYLQPCDTGDTHRNQSIVQQTIAHCLAVPQWRLSLQMHKLIGVK